ncbi:MAG: CBS domain-containing protein [Cyanobacteria bacterium REEB459]|nr:CBS domain-containing protein [Cyanobacteria bacterium REEB459]
MLVNAHSGPLPIHAAVDRCPLVVDPTTPLIDVIVLMSQTRGFSCTLADQTEPSAPLDFWHGESRSSCVLITEARRVVGIFTERDVVRLTASGIDLASVSIAEVMATPVITLAEDRFQEIFAALFLFRRYRIRHLVIVDGNSYLVGLVSHESIRQILRPTNLLKLRRVGEVMTPQAIYALPSTPITSLAQQMAEQRVSCVVIVEASDINRQERETVIPIGIVTERDVVQFQALGLNLAQTLAQTVMSGPLFLASPDDSLWDAHQVMQRHRVQRLVVSWNWGQGLGIITQTSLLRVFDPMEMYGVEDTLHQAAQTHGKPGEWGQTGSLMGNRPDAAIAIPEPAVPQSLGVLIRRLSHLSVCLQQLQLPEPQQQYVGELAAELEAICHQLAETDRRTP